VFNPLWPIKQFKWSFVALNAIAPLARNNKVAQFILSAL
jgi:hypothetical protein